MQSPDPHCLLHLDAVNQTSGRWVLSLPVFHSLAQLGASPWAEYIASLYAPLDDNDFPIDLRCFTFWWRTRLPAPLVKQYFVPHILQTPQHLTSTNIIRQPTGKRLYASEHIYMAQNGDVVPMGNGFGAWQIVMTSSVHRAINGREPLTEGYDPGARPALRIPFMTPLKPGSRVEVFHEAKDATCESGWWAHVAPGSGIWVGVGRTVAAGTEGGHDEACAVTLARHRPTLMRASAEYRQYMLNQNGTYPSDALALARIVCGTHLFARAHLEMAEAGRAAGIDTIQGLPCDEPGHPTTTQRAKRTVCRYAVPLISSTHLSSQHARLQPHTVSSSPPMAAATATQPDKGRIKLWDLPTRQAAWVRPFEMLLLSTRCDANGTACATDLGSCPTHGLLSRGRARAKQACFCDSAKKVVNCDGCGSKSISRL